ncbi:hypothetical protein M405DRAFT_939052 [Rhizopogon salebrosus TDB-379]|nr:hypothetical protein M405DRAFT_939066 [Rhizopogon salebrosus TDB-379]KAJ8579710.1 hypothetical protein M405DRAFT_939052 [Rhizopogon salebrosus TDB-379]
MSQNSALRVSVVVADVADHRSAIQDQPVAIPPTACEGSIYHKSPILFAF